MTIHSSISSWLKSLGISDGSENKKINIPNKRNKNMSNDGKLKSYGKMIFEYFMLTDEMVILTFIIISLAIWFGYRYTNTS